MTTFHKKHYYALNKKYPNEYVPLEPVVIQDEAIVPDYFKEVSNKITVKKIFDKIELSERELDILSMRFGLNGDFPHTFEYVGKKYNVTRERIRQIEGRAIEKIRKQLQLSMV